MSGNLPSDTEELLAQLERIGQGDFGNSLSDFPPPPPLPPSEDLPDPPTDLPPAPDLTDQFESVVTFSKGNNQSFLISCVLSILILLLVQNGKYLYSNRQ